MRIVVRALGCAVIVIIGFELVVASELPTPRPTPTPLPLPTWADEIAKGYLPYRQLTVDDFRFNENAGSETAYWVQPFIHYNYHGLAKMAHGGWVYAYVMDWSVFSGFDRNSSWRTNKPGEMKAELPYAQAILDINELYARRIGALQPGELPRGEGRNYAEARQLLDTRLERFYETQEHEIKKEFDALATATNHGQNKKKVRELSAEIKKRLAAVSPEAGGSPGLTGVPLTPTPSVTPAARTNPAKP